MRLFLQLLPVMGKRIMLTFLCFQLIALPSYSQIITSILYSNSGLPTCGVGTSSVTDVFANTPVIQGLPHSSLISIDHEFIDYQPPGPPLLIPLYPPGFYDNSVTLGASLTRLVVDGQSSLSNYYTTNAYRIGYTFDPGYAYFITMNCSGWNPNDYMGVGMSWGDAQFTNQIGNTGTAMTSTFGSSSSGNTLDNNYLGNTFYSQYFFGSDPAVSTDLTSTPFSVGVSTTGLNIEALPSPNTGTSYTQPNVNVNFLMINSVAITQIPLIDPNTAPVCSSQSYSINSSWPVSWSVAPAGIASLSASGNSATLTKIADGFVTLTASLTGTDGRIYPVSIPSIQVGNPHISILSTKTNGAAFLATAGKIPGATYAWYLNGNLETGQTYYTCTDLIDCGVTSHLYATATTACGVSQTPTVGIFIKCNGGGTQSIASDSLTGKAAIYSLDKGSTSWSGKQPANGPSNIFAAYPNPTTGNVRISRSNVAAGDAKIYMIRVVNLTGEVRKELQYTKGVTEADINISDLENGLYIVQLYDNRSWEAHKVVLLKK
jgi:hypothetical protein